MVRAVALGGVDVLDHRDLTPVHDMNDMLRKERDRARAVGGAQSVALEPTP